MPAPALEIDARNITLLGSFNPLIFQPAWFAQHDFISAEQAEGEALTLEVMVNDVVAFTADWLQVQVLTDRFTAATSNGAHFEELRDLVVAVFSILRHTPIHSMGVNRVSHFLMGSEDEWNAV